MIQAVIFDMDGVLLDSEPFISEAAVRMFAEKGFAVKHEDFIPFVGAGENRFLGGVAEKYGIVLDIEKDKKRTYEIYGEIIIGRIEPLPGVYEFLGHCREKGLKMAVATSADAIKLHQNLTELKIPQETFDACVTGSDVERKKPFPDCFLAAAEKLGVLPENCLVVEDAVNGVKAAKAAGSKCLALTTSFTREQLSQADWISSTLADAPAEATEW
ncbi:MAG: HAD-IA family hydrolase [Candidatus Omnitrophota bacterium]